jgi:hypothetical protein
MRSVDVSAVFPPSPEETWHFLFGDQLRHIVQFSPTVAAVEDYEMRPDGTPPLHDGQQTRPAPQAQHLRLFHLRMLDPFRQPRARSPSGWARST